MASPDADTGRTLIPVLRDGAGEFAVFDERGRDRTSEIAVELAYSERTIKHAISAMTSRLELRNRTQAVAFAVREGLI